jgi:ABC-type antimicrobial peptide transport system permease subunit
MDPLVLAISNQFSHDQISIRIAPGNLNETISYLESRFREIMPGIPFEYHFLDDRFDQLYIAETRASKIIGFLTIISIAIALFGIFALGSFAIQERTREIAIRKVCGIPDKNLIFLLTKDLLLLMLIGNLIAWPAAWWIMKNWLENFSYQTNLNLRIFPLATCLSLVVVFLIISIKAFQAARVNPAVSLKYE